MIDIVGKKNWFFAISAILIIPGLISLIMWGVKPGIDFTGGTLLEIKIDNKDTKLAKSDFEDTVSTLDLELESVQVSEDNSYLLRLKPINKDQNEELKNALSTKYGQLEELRFETVGPTVGQETTKKAINAVIVSSIGIIVYIALAFYKIPKPYSSWKFGMSAVAALIHDVIVVVGAFSLFGHFFSVEIDSLFITALLTVMGFSVHDSIVVFDRIRENLNKLPNRDFSEVVNISLVQTLARSLSTSMTVLFTLSSLLIFGGESIRWFVVALLVGIASGTYSSIFNAAPLLVAWNEWDTKKKEARRLK